MLWFEQNSVELVSMVWLGSDRVAGPGLENPEWAQPDACASAEEADMLPQGACAFLIFLWWLTSQRAKSHVAQK